MQIARAWEEEGVTIPAPNNRTIKILFAPDKGGVNPISFSHTLIHGKACTDMHSHDRPELIMVVAGRGISVCNGVRTPVQADMAIWVEAGEEHQMINTDSEMLKLLTLFVPAYTAEESYTLFRKKAEDVARAAEAAKGK